MMIEQLEQDRLEFRQEALVEEIDGTFYLTLHGSKFKDRWGDSFKKPFDPKHVNGLDDGDPHFVY